MREHFCNILRRYFESTDSYRDALGGEILSLYACMYVGFNLWWDTWRGWSIECVYLSDVSDFTRALFYIFFSILKRERGGGLVGTVATIMLDQLAKQVAVWLIEKIEYMFRFWPGFEPATILFTFSPFRFYKTNYLLHTQHIYNWLDLWRSS